MKKELKNLIRIYLKGGDGSGHHGHTGREGERGGSKNREDGNREKYEEDRAKFTLSDLINALKDK